jgi:hypothetical protein
MSFFQKKPPKATAPLPNYLNAALIFYFEVFFVWNYFIILYTVDIPITQAYALHYYRYSFKITLLLIYYNTTSNGLSLFLSKTFVIYFIAAGSFAIS